MNDNSSHISVLLKETIQNLDIHPNGIYIDCTFGYGGHSKEILKNLGKNGKLYSIDQDPYAIKMAEKLKNDLRFNIIHGSFSKILEYSKQNKILGKVNGIVLDLGMSSMQIDNPNRGFSFTLDGPLDMRMNPKTGIPANVWLKNTNFKTLHHILKTYGEEPFSKQISRNILSYRKEKPITRTLELSNIIIKSIPKKKYKKHPARKVFQAIRMHINQELYELKQVLKHVLKILAPGGKLLVISFHSLEDRMVKQFMNKNSKPPIVPLGLAVTEKQLQSLHKIQFKTVNKIFPNAMEIKRNLRARSSILRIAKKNDDK